MFQLNIEKSKAINKSDIIDSVEYFHKILLNDIPDIDPLENNPISFQLQLPTVGDNNNDIPITGLFIYVRIELICENRLAQYTIPKLIRIVPSLPPLNNINSNDVLLFSTSDMQSKDYEILQNICSVFSLKLYFLDIDHFMNKKTGIIDSDLWKGFLGIEVFIIF